MTAGGDSTPAGSARTARSSIGGWMRRIAGGRGATTSSDDSPASSVGRDVQQLPTLLDGASLPNGIVELVVEDLQAPVRQLFNVHDSVVAPIEPGSAVPWASISGTPAEWASALGPERELDALRLTGDQALARRVIAAFPVQS